MADGGNIEKTARKKSQKRQRSAQVKTPLTIEEFNEVAAKVSAAGLSFAAYSRNAMLGYSGDRSQRKPPVDAIMFRQAMGENNRVGNNINQIARYLNEGEALHTQVPELKEALRAYIRVTNALLEAMGKKPMEPTP